MMSAEPSFRRMTPWQRREMERISSAFQKYHPKLPEEIGADPRVYVIRMLRIHREEPCHGSRGGCR